MVNKSYHTLVDVDADGKLSTLKKALTLHLPDTWTTVDTTGISLIPWFGVPDGYNTRHISTSLNRDGSDLEGTSVTATGLDWYPDENPVALTLTCTVPSFSTVQDTQKRTITDGFNGVVFTEAPHPHIPLIRAPIQPEVESETPEFSTESLQSQQPDCESASQNSASVSPSTKQTNQLKELFVETINAEHAAESITSVNRQYNTTFSTTIDNHRTEQLTNDIPRSLFLHASNSK